GKLRYKFYVSPADRIPIMSREKLSNATFHILFYDRDGFQLLGIPVKLEEMQQVPSTFTPNPLLPKLPEQVKSIFESGSMNCDLNTYESVGNWSLGRSGF
ncbi:MAG: hypothetical protein KBH45_15180, partial [Verrucomicrobia bacterium]|nr:hypothetical protein [Verrucomicrobiota bacterium]